MKVTLKKEWVYDGKTYSPGDNTWIDISDDDVAKGLIDDGTAEAYTEPTKGTVTVEKAAGTPESVTGLTKEDVEEVVGKVLDKDSTKRVVITEVEKGQKGGMGFEDSTEFFRSVCKFYGGGGLDKRLEKCAGVPESVTKAVGSDEQRVIYDPVGGFLVPDVFSNDMLSIAPEEDPIGSRTTNIRMSSPNISIPVRADKNRTSSVSGGFSVSWTEETAAVATSVQKYDRIKLEAHELMGAVHVTEKLLRDSPISVVDLITRGFRDEYMATLADARLNGTGVGQPLGVFNSGCLITVSHPLDEPATLTEDIIAMRSRAWKYSNCVWMACQDALPTLVNLRLEVPDPATGNTVGTTLAAYQTSIREDVPDMLLGRPIIYTEYMPSWAATNNGLLLANWGEYLDGVHQDVQTATSIHVRFLNNEQTFRFTMSFDGMPWWRTALTPKNGANTLSPFVALGLTAS